MPIAEFPGGHGWGYDGIYLSAAHSAYGGPLGLQRLVDAAHGAGLAVVLDVVYNHLGASGVRAMEAFGPYHTAKYATPWGEAINLDDAGADPVREWILQSAEQWIRDFHVDGLRLDAIHALADSGPEHIVAAIARRVHGTNPRAVVIAESGMNDPKVMRPPERGGWGCDAAWADDFHHALRVALTGDTDGWYEEFADLGTLVKAFHRPHVHDGGYSTFRGRRFGARADDLPPEALRRVLQRPRPGRQPRVRRPAARARHARSLLCLPVWPRSRRCSSRGRSTASAGPSSSSRTTSTTRSPPPPARGAGASSPRSRRSARRSPTLRTP